MKMKLPLRKKKKFIPTCNEVTMILVNEDVDPPNKFDA